MRVLDIFIVSGSVLVSLSSGRPKCETYLDCRSCTNNSYGKKRACIWRPSDHTCHEYTTLGNPRLKDRVVRKPSMCQKVVNGTFIPQKALSYVLMSAAAYAGDPQKCLKKIYPKTDFEIQKIVTKSCEKLPLLKYEKCLAYTAVSHTEKVIVLAFRGTLVNNTQIFDEIISVLTIPKTTFPAGGKVQSFFANAHDILFQDVNASVSHLVRTYPTYDVVVTGHSLGGALASLTAMSLVYMKVVPESRMSLYTYGLPRVGNEDYAINHDRLVNESWRVVHYRDIVSHLPTCNLITGCSGRHGPYHHGTEIFYPEVPMTVGSQYIQCKDDEDMKCSDGLIRKKPCILDVFKCIDFHKEYFGVPVGTICEND